MLCCTVPGVGLYKGRKSDLKLAQPRHFCAYTSFSHRAASAVSEQLIWYRQRGGDALRFGVNIPPLERCASPPTILERGSLLKTYRESVTTSTLLMLKLNLIW